MYIAKEWRKMRKRRNVITIRMDDGEYSLLRKKVRESGLSQQAFIISAISGAAIPSSEELEILKNANRNLADLVRQLRGLAANVNQIARTANGFSILPAVRELTQIRDEVMAFKEESEKIWQLIRLLISLGRPMEQ